MRQITQLFSRNKSLTQIETFFLTYDEPLKEERWKRISSILPNAKWIDGVKGFDRAHKVCAERTKGRRFIVIDGDNILQPRFIKECITSDLDNSNFVLSWSSINSINGLEYGNGGVKCWDKEVVLQMKTHEVSEKPNTMTDFCFEVPYYQIPHSLSITEVHLTPKQAFRAGFREGIKMSLNRGCVMNGSDLEKGLDQVVPKRNFFRLMTWMSVGADVHNGVWAILGARVGLFSLLFGGLSLENLQDYDWFDLYWNEEVKVDFSGTEAHCKVSNYFWSYQKVVRAINQAGKNLYECAKLEVPFHPPKYSALLKRSLPNPKRSGLMYEH